MGKSLAGAAAKLAGFVPGQKAAVVVNAQEAAGENSEAKPGRWPRNKLTLGGNFFQDT